MAQRLFFSRIQFWRSEAREMVQNEGPRVLDPSDIGMNLQALFFWLTVC